ncbi:MAG: MraY family glycosyltransferase [Candidatus Omnitrophica bacterium]|nr:MraY family glycosyltransferase [Candidatus Omnitrophota bacterium]
MDYFFIIAVAFIIVFLITPNIRYAALKFYVIDKVGHRKIHKKLVTKLGGLAIYLGFLGGIFTLVVFDLLFFKINFYPLTSLLIASSLMLILGIYDDFQGSGAWIKFSIQVIVSLLVIKSGFILESVFIPGFIDLKLGIFSIPVTLFWLVGITNAANLIDGLDGLAAGIIGIALSFIAIFGLILNDNFIICIALALSAASLSFLKYNFFPAKIFMGDTGSLFLGLVIACLAIYRPSTHSGNPYFIPTVIVFFLPILDTALAMARRLLRKQNIFSGDSSHIHHYFLKRGFSQAQTVMRFYLMTFVLGVMALFVLFMSIPR